MSKNKAFLALTVILLLSIMAEVTLVNAYTYESESDTLKVVLDYPDSTIYLGQPINIVANVSGGTQPYTYQWDLEKILNWNPLISEHTKLQLNASNFTFVPDSEGTYHVSVAINDSAGHHINISPIFSLYFKVVLPPSQTPLPSASPTVEPSQSIIPSPSASSTPSPSQSPTIEPSSTTAIHDTSTNIIPYVIIVFVTVVIWIILLIHQKRKWNRIKKLG
jgi:hypothetical protein